MKLLRETIRKVIKEMGYIDEYPPGHPAFEKYGELQDPSVAKTYTDQATRLKKKRIKPPRVWMKVINVLLAGGTISVPYPSSSKSYALNDAKGDVVGKIRHTTFEDLEASGYLEGGEYEGFYRLSDEGRGYLK